MDLLKGMEGRGGSEDSTEEDSGEIELSLGLSLGGCFGVDPRKKGVLVRSSSVASIPVGGAEDVEVETGTLARTCSLPAAAATGEEQQRKRKSVKVTSGADAKRGRAERLVGEAWADGVGVSGAVGDAGRCPSAVAKRAVSQRSAGSQGSCTADATNSGGGGLQGLEGSTNVERKSFITHPMHKMVSQATNPSIRPVAVAGDDTPKTEVETSGNRLMEQMPCVSARGQGPNGRLVEGFLYKYKKGEDVKIVCICHGRFLTPAEFVRHAGGGDVAYPLRHIVMKPSPFTFL